MNRLHWLLVVGICLSFARGASAQSAPEALTSAERQAIRKVIESQIQAFQHDDGKAAFALASPSIQAQFGTADNFMQMVRDGYQAVYRPRRYQFLELRMVDGYLMQKIAIIGPDGLAVVAMYPMIQLPDGTWRTDGCYLLPVESKGA